MGILAIVAVWVLVPKSPPPEAVATTTGEPAVVVAQAPNPPTPNPGPSAERTGDGSLRVCNQTSNPVSIALGYRADRGWQSEGWWVAQPTECARVLTASSTRAIYYLYAADDIGGGSWDGDQLHVHPRRDLHHFRC